MIATPSLLDAHKVSLVRSVDCVISIFHLAAKQDTAEAIHHNVDTLCVPGCSKRVNLIQEDDAAWKHLRRLEHF